MNGNEPPTPVDDVYMWVEQETSVMLKAVTRDGDPVELTASETRAVANTLLKFAAQLEASG